MRSALDAIEDYSGFAQTRFALGFVGRNHPAANSSLWRRRKSAKGESIANRSTRNGCVAPPQKISLIENGGGARRTTRVVTRANPPRGDNERNGIVNQNETPWTKIKRLKCESTTPDV